MTSTNLIAVGNKIYVTLKSSKKQNPTKSQKK